MNQFWLLIKALNHSTSAKPPQLEQPIPLQYELQSFLPWSVEKKISSLVKLGLTNWAVVLSGPSWDTLGWPGTFLIAMTGQGQGCYWRPVGRERPGMQLSILQSTGQPRHGTARQNVNNVKVSCKYPHDTDLPPSIPFLCHCRQVYWLCAVKTI